METTKINIDQKNWKVKVDTILNDQDLIQIENICVMKGTDSEAKSNAKLISAAPDMLESLQEITDFVEKMVEAKMISHIIGKTIRNRANAVIKKATE